MGEGKHKFLCSVFVAILLCVILDFSVAADEADADKQMSNIQKLKDKLFKNYDKNVRPVIHHTNTTNVSISLAPLYLIDFDEEKSLLTMDTWLLLFWVDYRLAWNSSEFDGVTTLEVGDDTVWQPDVKIYNAHSGDVDPKKNTPLILYSSGGVLFVPPAVLNTFCAMEFNGSYQNDVIECEVHFGSWAHDGWQIDLHLHDEKMYLDEFSNTNPRWEVVVDQLNITKDVKKYNCCEEPYITIIAKFPLKRRPPPELQVVWSPCILIMTLTLAMFWIPSDSGKKITLGATLFFSLIILTVYVAALTKSPGRIRLAVSFLESMLYAVVSATLLELFVVNLSRVTGPCRPPTVTVDLLAGSIGKYMCVWAPWQVNIPGDRVQLKEDIEHVVSTPSIKDEWMLVATGLDRIFFVIYCFVFIGIHQV